MFESCCVVFIPPKSIYPAVSSGLARVQLGSSSGPARVRPVLTGSQKNVQLMDCRGYCPEVPVLNVSGLSWMQCVRCWTDPHLHKCSWTQPRLSTCWCHSGVFWAQWMRGGELSSSVRTAEPSGVSTWEQASRETHIFRVIATDKNGGGQCCLSHFTRDTCETKIDLCASEHTC